MAGIKLNRLDHLVLTVSNIDTTCAFYQRVLGMRVVTFGPQSRKALLFGSQKINLHEKGSEFKPNARVAEPGTADLCFIADTGIEAVRTHLQKEQIPLEMDLIERTGATGPIRSIYIRDPDGNLLEISNYV
ncbi:putative Glyoxalase domain-containing protein 5-like protein [Hypsibius exemplaris]|uniref:Glyoxalase domain-containing protein 5 n=1 Tax=Hypsibius exemplaris TaxID=2072580 RepID=A0A1W0XDB5_HYPEX|nr:putative Glyoxalase domain-containing protein 5-like protein [Hypsibius exemplaris]